jgi:hypothetical protein
MNKHDKRYIIDRSNYSASELSEYEAAKILKAIKDNGYKETIMMKITKYTAISLVIAVIAFIVMMLTKGGW